MALSTPVRLELWLLKLLLGKFLKQKFSPVDDTSSQAWAPPVCRERHPRTAVVDISDSLIISLNYHHWQAAAERRGGRRKGGLVPA
jgi:hypothetical protein